MPNYDYDMLVIGSGPTGHHAVIQAAKLGNKVGVVSAKASSVETGHRGVSQGRDQHKANVFDMDRRSCRRWNRCYRVS